jgi:hypothetical protein
LAASLYNFEFREKKVGEDYLLVFMSLLIGITTVSLPIYFVFVVISHKERLDFS